MRPQSFAKSRLHWHRRRKTLSVFTRTRVQPTEMPTNPFDNVADDERTDELPVLVETVVLGHAAATTTEGDSLEDTAQRAAKFPSPVPGSTAEIESLQTDLAARGAKIATLEED